MDQATINRYQALNPDTGAQGDIYARILAQHGQTAAEACAAAALTGDETQINAALTLYMTASGDATVAVPLADDSTLSNFTRQITTDPLAAPLASANKILGNTFFSFLKNPWVVVTIAVVVFFFVFDGLNIIKGKLKA